MGGEVGGWERDTRRTQDPRTGASLLIFKSSRSVTVIIFLCPLSGAGRHHDNKENWVNNVLGECGQ